ncbi:unnamed protein product [Dimorphilus gyrociliatus]|uniref:ELMO domain-containing protein n=1 Tax=Dimorphilus gyrociliatus TaxID=2664684 RepID=A0A7I8VGC7_9ANNE|nr:unnamed protein product [Dimorphilus gyrociliatus]
MHRSDIFSPYSFESTITICISQICGYKKLIDDITTLRKSPYLCENNEHEEKLQKLWNLLEPDEPLEARVTKQWTTIGFQGSDPKTDFRGMGLLGLENLVYFSKESTDLARSVLLQSRNPAHEYSFAIVGINITAMIVDLLLKNHLKNHFYNSIMGEPTIEDFHNIYICIFNDFHKHWLKDKPGIMNFNIYKEKYRRILLEKLRRKDCVLTLGQAS